MGTPGDPGEGSDEHRRAQLHCGVDLDAFPQPYARPYLEPGRRRTHGPGEDVLLNAQVGVQRADVLPIPGGHVTHDQAALFQQSGDDVLGPVHGLVSGDQVQDGGVHTVNSGVRADH